MFLGEFEHSVDSKGRVVMPRAFRDELAGDVVVTKGRDGNLVVYKAERYEMEAEEIAESVTDKSSRSFARTFFSSAIEQSVDEKTGRVLISEPLREYAGLETGGDVVVIGNFRTIELWNKDRYLVEKARGEAQFLEMDEEGDPTDS